MFELSQPPIEAILDNMQSSRFSQAREFASVKLPAIELDAAFAVEMEMDDLFHLEPLEVVIVQGANRDELAGGRHR